MANFSITLTGVEAMQQRLSALIRSVPQRVAAAFYQEAEIEMTESKSRVPVKTGALRASGHVHEPEILPHEILVRLGYDAPYAVIVHEDLEAHHVNGEAKFLESVLRESVPTLLERLARRIDLSAAR